MREGTSWVWSRPLVIPDNWTHGELFYDGRRGCYVVRKVEHTEVATFTDYPSARACMAAQAVPRPSAASEAREDEHGE